MKRTFNNLDIQLYPKCIGGLEHFPSNIVIKLDEVFYAKCQHVPYRVDRSHLEFTAREITNQKPQCTHLAFADGFAILYMGPLKTVNVQHLG